MSGDGLLLLGVDLGTTGTRAAVYDAAGTLHGEGHAPVPLEWEGSGRVRQDPEVFCRSAAAAIAAAVRACPSPGSVGAIAFSGQMAGVLGVDRQLRPTTPYDSWLDVRCREEVEWLHRELGDELMALTGCPPMINHAPKLRWWATHQPDTFADTVAWVVPGSFVAARFAGLDGSAAFLDDTYAHFTGLVDAREGRWSERLMDVLQVDQDHLARLVSPHAVVGTLTARAADACGLRAGTPIAAGLGDTAACVLGAGGVRPGELVDSAGTAAVLAGVVGDFRPDVEARTLLTMRSPLNGQWVSLAFLSGGSLLGWVARLVLDLDEDVDPETAALERLTSEATAVPPGADGLMFVPHLNGRLLPSEPGLAGAWVGLHSGHRRRHLTRAVLESVGFEYLGYLHRLQALHPELSFEVARGVGGGARSASWCALKASMLGVRYRTLAREEPGCWGAALVAGAAIGAIDDLGRAAERAALAGIAAEPVAAVESAYARLEPIYRELVQCLREPSRRLRASAMAPEEVPA